MFELTKSRSFAMESRRATPSKAHCFPRGIRGRAARGAGDFEVISMVMFPFLAGAFTYTVKSE
jgi:hypothetical protein